MKKEKGKTGNKAQARPQTFKALIIRGCSLAAIIICILFILEKKQIFVEDSSNNHVEWKWDWYYKLKERRVPIDVLFVGNSHLITGIDPYLFTRQTGLNSFLIGASGVDIADLYFTVEEALKVQKPKILVLETYAINEREPRELEGGALNDEISSFRARRNTWLKLKSTPALFNWRNYPIAWCETFRNHNYIFTKPDQVARNLKGEGPNRRVRNDLYLGQFARFSKGLSQATLDRYKNEGAPVDGNEYEVCKSAVKYTEKIAELCKENDIQLIFLTIPMYSAHVCNYPAWRSKLESHIGGLTPYWLDLQALQSNLGSVYTPAAFQDTYSENQHLTNYGMAVTANIFARYLSQTLPGLPSRKNDPQWQKFVAGFPK